MSAHGLFILYRRQYHAILLEFLPQIIFLIFLFGYLITMIFIKWAKYGANYDGMWSEHCAPNLLITFIRCNGPLTIDYTIIKWLFMQHDAV